MLRRGLSLRSLNINPSFVHSPLTLVPDMAEIIKAEPTAHTTQQSYLFVPRHGGSGEPALPMTEVVDRCRKRRVSAAKVIKSVQC